VTMLAEKRAGAAYGALSKPARRALAYIERAIDDRGDGAVVTHDDLALDAHISRDEIAPAVRELVAVGFVVVGSDEAKRRTFSRSFRWRNVTSTDEAAQLCAAARLPLPKRAPAPRTPPAPASGAEDRRHLHVNQARGTEAASDRGARPISLPKLPPPWGDD
jgi:hypothetical protein